MDERIGKLEVAVARVETRLDGIDAGLTEIRAVLRRLEEKMLTPADIAKAIHDQSLSKWDVAKVVGAVIGFFTAAVLLGPRLLAMLPTSPP